MNDNESKESLLGLLRAAIDIEKFGIRYYRGLSGAVSDENGKRLLDYLADAEEDHQRTLEQKFDEMKEIGDETLKPLPLEELDKDGDISIFSEPLDEVDPQDISHIDAMKYGIKVEERSIKFYNGLARAAGDPELKRTLTELVKFEIEHLELLKKNLKQMEADGSWAGCEIH